MTASYNRTLNQSTELPLINVPGGIGNTNQPYNPKADRGVSSLNIGQTFVINPRQMQFGLKLMF